MSDRVDEIKKRLAEATPGPWQGGDKRDYCEAARVFEVGAWDYENHCVLPSAPADQIPVCLVHSKADLALIAHAPSDLAYLLHALSVSRQHEADGREALRRERAEVERLRAENERLKEECCDLREAVDRSTP